MPHPRFLDLYRLLFLSALTFASGCARSSTPTPFRPPTFIAATRPAPTVTLPSAIASSAVTVTSAPTEGACTNNLTFIGDATIPDDTVIVPGASVDKQWLVQNSGSCDWDSSYGLKWIGGDTLGAEQEQPLYPARAGTPATLRIVFTAPPVDASYESAWQAMDPHGNVFGDLIFIKIIVAAP